MPSTTDQTKQFFERYLDALNGKPKTAESMSPFVADPHLIQHILMSEAAFPNYEIRVDQLIAEGNAVAVRGAFQGAHTGSVPGIPATGKHITASAMLFYTIDNDKITQFWMLPDAETFMQKLSAPA